MTDSIFLNQKPGIIQGFLIRNNPVVFTIGADNSRWPSTLSLEIGSATTDVVPLVFSASRFEDGDQVAVWELDAAVVEDIYAKFGGYPSVRITWGVDAAKTIQFAGRLFWVDEWRGSKSDDVQSFGHYIVGPLGPEGPEGPSAVSEDENNIATIGSDSKIYVPSVVPYVHNHDDRYFTEEEVTNLVAVQQVALAEMQAQIDGLGGGGGGGLTVTDNLDGTLTIDGTTIADNLDGTLTIGA